MNQYEDNEGKPRSALNIIQRESLYPTSTVLTHHFGVEKFEVLSPKKPQA